MVKSNFKNKLKSKIKSNLKVYKRDLKVKGVYWSLVNRLLKIPAAQIWLSPIINWLKPKKIQVNGTTIFLDTEDNLVSEILISEKQWEPLSTNIIRKKLKSGDVFVDVGAHIGYFTLLAANLVGQNGKVYAFEPYAHNRAFIKRNVIENNFKNVIIENKAVSDRSGRTKLFISNEATGDNRIFDSKDNRKKITVDMVKLDDYFKNKKIDMIKIDVQGVDYKVLKGARKILEKNQNIKIFVEFYPEGLRLAGDDEITFLDYLQKQRFKIFYLNANSNKIERIKIRKFIKHFHKNKKIDANLYCYR